MEVKNSSLCLFDKPAVQTDILGYQVVDYYPLNNVSAGGPFEILVPGSADDYIDVNSINMYLRLKITKEADGKNIKTADDKVGLNNLAIASLFEDVSLTLGDTQIEGGQGNYPYLAYFNTVMQFTPSAQKSHMRSWGWYKDEAGKFEDEANKGFVQRQELSKDSKTFELQGPLFLDFFRQSQLLLSQTDMRIKLRPSKPEFVLNAYGATKEFNIEFEDVILYVTRYTVNPSVINGHATGLSRQNAIYPVNHCELLPYSVPKGQQSWSKNIFPVQAPKLLIMGMIENESFNGSISKNPFHFQHFDLTKLALYSDCKSIPGQPFNPDFASGKTLRSYVHLMSTFGYSYTDDTNGLTLEEFQNGYTFYAFDLTADKSADSGHRQAIPSKNLRLSLAFRGPLKTTVNILLFAVYDSAIEITKLRDVITHYTR